MSSSLSPLFEKTLESAHYFEIYPFDSGGYLLHSQIAKSLNDHDIVNAVIHENILAPWGDLPNLDFTRLERWRTVEQSCWLNRMYFIASMARVAWREKDTQLAAVMKTIILYFLRNYAPPKDSEVLSFVREVERRRREEYDVRSQEENARDETDIQYLWYDFQPASRILHITFALWVLQQLNAVSDAEYAEILDSIKAHAIFLKMVAAVEPLQESDNHQSVRGAALIWAARLFQGTPEGEEFLKHGLNVCRFHAENDFAEDGSLKEVSPSYHCFELWHVRDAMMIAKELGTSLGDKAERYYLKAVSYVEALLQPDGCLPVIDDAYASPTTAFLKTLPANQIDTTQTQRYWFADAGLAVYKNSERYVLFDASPFTGKASHYHAGKNAVTCWQNGRPIFIDSGCCCYDDMLLMSWYKTGNAHSSLLINGQGDGDLIGTYNWTQYPTIECAGWQDESRAEITSRLTSNSPAWAGVKWQRTLDISNEAGLVISDNIELSEPAEVTLCFNLHPDVELDIQGKTAVLTNGPVCLKMEIQSESIENLRLKQNPGRCYLNGKHVDNSQLHICVCMQNKIVLQTILSNCVGTEA